jgi:RNA polymerase sigma-70 factor (ECF subfamily)
MADRESGRTDAELARAIAAGDRSALEELYRRHAPWLLLRLSRRCADPEVIDEALQDTFMAVWRDAGRWRGDGPLGAWLWGIAVRRLIDGLRRRPRAQAMEAATMATAMSPVESAEDRVLVGVEYGDLGGALQRLSPELRAVVEATVLDGLTTKEAGRLLGIPTGTVKTRMMRARAQLRSALA